MPRPSPLPPSLAGLTSKPPSLVLTCRARCQGSAQPPKAQQQQQEEPEPVHAVASRRQLFAGAAATAAALAMGGLPRPALAADPANVIDGQGETFLVPTSAVENFTAAQRQVGCADLATAGKAELERPAVVGVCVACDDAVLLESQATGAAKSCAAAKILLRSRCGSLPGRNAPGETPADFGTRLPMPSA